MPWLAFPELCEGGSLTERIAYHERAGVAMPERQAALYTEQVLSAASYCHQRGVLHRDLKPDNVLFLAREAESPLKVIDFGLGSTEARLLASCRVEQAPRQLGVLGSAVAQLGLIDTHVARDTMQRAGTPHYMAPEVYDPGHYGSKVLEEDWRREADVDEARRRRVTLEE